MKRGLFGSLLIGALACGGDGTAPSPPAAIAVSPAVVFLPLGNTVQLIVTVKDANGRTIPDASVTYTPATPSIVTVNAAGLVHAVGVGATTIGVASGPAGTSLPVTVATHPAGDTAGKPAIASRPFAVAISRSGVAYAGRQDLPYLQITQLPDTAFGDSVRVGSDPTDIAFDTAGTTAYVTNQTSSTFGIIDVAGKQSVDSVSIPTPFRVLVAPDNQHVYVSDAGGEVVEIASATKGVSRSWPLMGGSVNGLALHPDGSILYATTTSGVIFEITLSTGGVRSVSPGGTLQDIAVSLDGTEMYVANEGGDLDVRDVSTGARITTIPAAADAFGLKLSPDGTQLYATITGAGQIKIIDRATRTVTKTLTVGGSPRRIAFDRFGLTALVGNESGFISVIR